MGAVAVGAAPRSSPDFISQDHANGYSQQLNFTVQRELGGNMLFEAAYLGNLGRKLGGGAVNINVIPLVNGRGPATRSQTARPFPQFNNVMRLTPNWGSSSYHALNLKVERRYSNGFNLLANYTYSKFLDNIEGVANSRVERAMAIRIRSCVRWISRIQEMTCGTGSWQQCV